MAQKIGSGAAFILGVGIIFIWRAYIKELDYSKSRDVQTLTVLTNLTVIVQGLEKRDNEFAIKQEQMSNSLLTAIGGLRELIMSHYPIKVRQ